MKLTFSLILMITALNTVFAMDNAGADNKTLQEKLSSFVNQESLQEGYSPIKDCILASRFWHKALSEKFEHLLSSEIIERHHFPITYEIEGALCKEVPHCHFYIVLKPIDGHANAIIFDPTYLQFFQEAPESCKEMFIGTVEEFRKLISDNRLNLEVFETKMSLLEKELPRFILNNWGIDSEGTIKSRKLDKAEREQLRTRFVSKPRTKVVPLLAAPKITECDKKIVIGKITLGFFPDDDPTRYILKVFKNGRALSCGMKLSLNDGGKLLELAAHDPMALIPELRSWGNSGSRIASLIEAEINIGTSEF